MKWAVLAVFSLVAGLSQLLWLNFAPLIVLVERKYGVTEGAAGLLLLVFPLVYVLASIPAGALIDKKGYRFGVCLGAFLMAVFAALRVDERSFAVLLLAQTGIAAGQPFVVNSISKLVLDWFDKEQGAVATGLGTMGMFIGMSAGLAATPVLVERLGYASAMGVFALVSVAALILALLVIKKNPAGPPGAADDASAALPLKVLTGFFRERQLVLLFLLSFLGLGFFNGLTTWIELILAPYGIDSIQAGSVGAMLILGGIVGAAAVPALSDVFRRRKPFLIGSIAAALVTILPLCGTGNFHRLLVLAAVQGFFFLPAFSLLLEMCSEWAGAARAGSATGVLMLMGNAGGVVVIVVMEAIKGKDFRPSVYFLFALLAVAAVVSLALAESHPRRRKSA